MVRTVLASISALALAAAPLAAAGAAPRGSAAVAGERIGGHKWAPILALFAVLAAVLLLAGNSDRPTSP